jgi:hypothetical protein
MIINNQSHAEYLADPAIKSSRAKLVLKSTQLYHDAETGIYRQPETVSLSIGTIIHMAILQPDLFNQNVVFSGPINPATGNEYGRDTKKWAEWQNDNPSKIVVDKSLLLMIQRMPSEIKSMYESGNTEQSVYADDFKNGLRVSCRNDHICGNQINDLKSIDDIDNAERHIARYNYWFQAAWYRMVMKLETGDKHQFRFVFCEKKPPYRWRVLELDAGYIMYADEKCRMVVAEIADAIRRNDWTDRVDIIQQVSLPNYMQDFDEEE